MNNVFHQSEVAELERADMIRRSLVQSELIIKGGSALHDCDSKDIEGV